MFTSASRFFSSLLSSRRNSAFLRFIVFFLFILALLFTDMRGVVVVAFVAVVVAAGVSVAVSKPQNGVVEWLASYGGVEAFKPSPTEVCRRAGFK